MTVRSASPRDPDVRRARRARRGMLVVVGVVGVVLSLVLAAAQRSREARTFRAEFDRRAQERVSAIEREFLDSIEHVESLAALYAASERVTRSEFRTFSASLLEGHASIRAFGYNPVVRDAERAEHERRVRGDGFPSYAITERDANGRLVPAGRRDEYVVVAFIEPFEGNEAAMGYDIASEPARREALIRARDERRPAVTSRLRLVQDVADRWGVLICVPDFDDPMHDADDGRRGMLRGYAVGVLDIDDVVEEALADLRPTGIHLRIRDESANPGERDLYTHISRTLSLEAIDDLEPIAWTSDVHEPHVFDLAGRRWSVQAAPTPAYVASGRTDLPLGLLIAGLVATGLLVGYLAWQTSVSKRLEQAIEDRDRAERRQAGFGRMLDESHDEIYVFDAGTLRFVHVNQGALNNVGYSMDEMRGLTPIDLKPRMSKDSFEALLAPLRDGTRPKVEFTTAHRRKDGSLYDVEVHLQLSTFDGAPAFVATILDITDRILLEERVRQSQRLEALGTLAGGIAHDFNNLLTAIVGFTELGLAEAPPDSALRRHLSEVATAAERARGVVRRILTFSRRGTLERSPIALRDLIREVLQLMRASLPSSIKIRAELEDACETVGDPTQLHQVVMNLCTNAAQAMPGGRGTLEIGLESRGVDAIEAERLGGLEPGSYARIRVRDDGHGISPEILGRVFDPFFTTKDVDEGTGMGLAVAHGIATAHDGTITVDSTPGQGSTFDVYIPIRTAEAVEIDPIESATTVDPTAQGRESILVVDDEPVNVELFRDILERFGYEVEAFTDSVQALEAFKARHGTFDLVVTDYTMPGMTGIGLAREMSGIAPGFPVILISGHGEALDETEVRESGIRAVLSKPLHLQDLVARVRRELDLASDPAPGDRA